MRCLPRTQAAANAGGQTICSLFSLKPMLDGGKFLDTTSLHRQDAGTRAAEVLARITPLLGDPKLLSMLILDEISFIGCDLLAHVE